MNDDVPLWPGSNPAAGAPVTADVPACEEVKEILEQAK